mgnify:CR=1 FL=1
MINMLKNTKRIQVDILSNFGNTAYQKISKDIHFENIPNELYELWYFPDEFSFIRLIDLNNLQYLSSNELSEYHSQLIILKNKLEIIFNDIEKNRLIKESIKVNKKRITLLKKLIDLLEGEYK